MKSIPVILCLVTELFATPVITRQSLLRQANRDQYCSHLLHFNNYFYSLDEQRNLTGTPADLSIHWKTGNIFYTLISDEMKMSLQVLHPSNETEIIKVAGLGQSTCVDNLNDIVYLATDNGVYKYKDDGSIELYTALGEDVMYIAVTNDGSTMYIATWPQNRVQKITNDGQKQETFAPIPNGHGLTIDTRNNMYFAATKTSYVLKNGHNVPIKIKGLPSDRMTGVFVSRSDDVFAMDENSNFYKIDPENASAKHLGTFSIGGVNTFGLDSADNIYIGVKGGINKFTAHETSPCADFENQNVKGKKFTKRRKHKKTTTSTTEATYEDE
ncbi:unnamed protein product [Pieris macdunnoughi]|uniref:Uncharacterized protein n=1 Tax=Pieris macdunnoughi TaxID=345717 RepID=A0A821XLA8_9NEOP|nr:unnamed protein product [Pieris macdunnoughi]